MYGGVGTGGGYGDGVGGEEGFSSYSSYTVRKIEEDSERRKRRHATLEETPEEPHLLQVRKTMLFLFLYLFFFCTISSIHDSSSITLPSSTFSVFHHHLTLFFPHPLSLFLPFPHSFLPQQLTRAREEYFEEVRAVDTSLCGHKLVCEVASAAARGLPLPPEERAIFEVLW